MNLHVVFTQGNCCQRPRPLEYKAECLLSVPRTEQVSSSRVAGGGSESQGRGLQRSQQRAGGGKQGPRASSRSALTGLLLPPQSTQLPSHTVGGRKVDDQGGGWWQKWLLLGDGRGRGDLYKAVQAPHSILCGPGDKEALLPAPASSPSHAHLDQSSSAPAALCSTHPTEGLTDGAGCPWSRVPWCKSGRYPFLGFFTLTRPPFVFLPSRQWQA